MPRILVFDVNETLLDVSAMEPHFIRIFGEPSALRDWFSLLLLHSEVAALAGPYFDFLTLGRAVLTMVAESRQAALSEGDIERTLRAMLSLPPHPEVPEALRALQTAGLRLVALTNSGQRSAEQQLENAGLAQFFERVFSVDSVQRYKPAPEPYQMVASELNVPPSGLRLVAAHAWDIVGAMRVGFAGAFVARPGKVLFPLAPRPDIVGQDLAVVASKILQIEGSRGA
jgi:2-haloacid dehalogenase